MDLPLSLYYPACVSIGKMNENELSQYSAVDNWVQNRKLFNVQVQKKDSKHESYESSINTWMYDNEQHIFNRTFARLQNTDIYVDVGAGDGKALLQYRKIHPTKASVIGIASHLPHSIEKIKKLDAEDNKFSFYLCDFKNFSIGSLAGKVSVITDIKGAFVYGLDPVHMIQKMGEMLKDGGLVFINTAGKVRLQVPENCPGLFPSKEINLSQDLLHVWFRTIKGFDYVDREFEDWEKKLYRRPDSFDESATKSEHPISMTLFYFRPDVVILRRNSEAIEIDPLIAHPNIVENWEKAAKHTNAWHANYTWEVSERTKTFLSKKKIALFD